MVPVLVWLAIGAGRRSFVAAAAGGIVGFVAIGMWGYVLNLADTGHVLGAGTGGVEDRASPSVSGKRRNVFYLLYGLMDLSGPLQRPDRVARVARRAARGGGGRAVAPRRDAAERRLATALGVALPFLAPAARPRRRGSVAFAARQLGLPDPGPGACSGR